MPLLYHPTIPTQFMRLSSHLATHGVTNVSHLYSPPRRIFCKVCNKKIAALREQLALTPWSLSLGLRRPPTSSAVHIWPAMRNASGCIRIFTAPVSLLTKHYQIGTVPSPGAGYPFTPYADTTSPTPPVLSLPPSQLLYTSGQTDPPQTTVLNIAPQALPGLLTCASTTTPPPRVFLWITMLLKLQR